MATSVLPNAYGYRVVEKGQQHIQMSNGTTRVLLYGEMVVVVDGNSNAFIGIVAEPAGIAASGGVGRVDLNQGNVIQTNQVADAQTFTALNTNVYVSPQTNGGAAAIYAASDTGRFALKALITRKASNNSWVELLMPPQSGDLTAAS